AAGGWGNGGGGGGGRVVGVGVRAAPGRRLARDGQLGPRVGGEAIRSLSRRRRLATGIHVLHDEPSRYRAESRLARVGPNQDSTRLSVLTEIRLSPVTRPAHGAQFSPVLPPEPAGAKLVLIPRTHLERGREVRPGEVQPRGDGPPRIESVLGAALGLDTGGRSPNRRGVLEALGENPLGSYVEADLPPPEAVSTC